MRQLQNQSRYTLNGVGFKFLLWYSSSLHACNAVFKKVLYCLAHFPLALALRQKWTINWHQNRDPLLFTPKHFSFYVNIFFFKAQTILNPSPLCFLREFTWLKAQSCSHSKTIQPESPRLCQELFGRQKDVVRPHLGFDWKDPATQTRNVLG